MGSGHLLKEAGGSVSRFPWRTLVSKNKSWCHQHVEPRPIQLQDLLSECSLVDQRVELDELQGLHCS